MTEKIILRQSEYDLLKLVLESPGCEIGYHALMRKSVLSETSFRNKICILKKVGVISTEGKTTEKIVYAEKLLRQVDIGQVTRGERGQDNSKPPIRKYTGQAKKRKCLRCSYEFQSGWKGERICTTCKTSPVWKSGGDAEYAVGVR